MVRTYDPKKVILTVGGTPINGYADGTFISVERENDTFTKQSGADGQVARAKTNDKTGMLTVTLQQTSLSNDTLSAIMKLDETTGNGVVPISLTDKRGTTKMIAAQGWIRKPPVIEEAKEVSSREWTIDLANMEVFVGGNI